MQEWECHFILFRFVSELVRSRIACIDIGLEDYIEWA